MLFHFKCYIFLALFNASFGLLVPVLIVWTEEKIFSINNTNRENHEIFVENKTSNKENIFLAKSSEIELIYWKNETKLELKFNSNFITIKKTLKWISNTKNFFEIQIIGKTIEVEIRAKNEEIFRLKWCPKRRFISLETNLISNQLKLESRENRKSSQTGNETEIIDRNEVICRKWLSNKKQINAREQQLCENARDFCNFGSTLVSSETITRIPNECLDCDSRSGHVFGGQKHVSRLESAEILFLIGCDLESGQMKKSLVRISNALSREFRSRGVHARFQTMKLRSRDGIRKYTYFWPKFESKLNLNRILFTENTSHSLDFFLVSSYPSSASSRHIMLITCEEECSLDHVDFITARSLLLNSEIFIHVITTQSFRIRAKKARHVLGIDSHFAFTATTKTRELRQHISVSRDLCHVLSLETNGTVFRAKSLTQKNSRAILAKRIADNHVSDTCLKCDCVLSRDKMTSNTECLRCEERKATISGVTDDNAEDSQEWDETDYETEEE